MNVCGKKGCNATLVRTTQNMVPKMLTFDADEKPIKYDPRHTILSYACTKCQSRWKVTQHAGDPDRIEKMTA